jgi:hypothetical protein
MCGECNWPEEKWTKVEDDLPNWHGIVMTKRANGDQVKCYFHADKMIWLAFYGKDTSHFQDYKTLQFLHDITHWRNIEKLNGM